MKDFKVKIRSGSSIVKVKPIVSYNSKCLIIASGPNIKIFNVQSSECLHTLRYHKKDIISLQENKNNCLQFFSCSEDGIVVRWEVVEGTLLKVYDLQRPVTNFFVSKNTTGLFYVVELSKNLDQHRFFALQHSRKDIVRHKIFNAVLPHQNAISFGFEESFIAAVYDNSLQIYQSDSKKFFKHLTGTFQLKCVVCHPSDLVVATGDDKGRVLIWTNVFQSKNPIRSIYHWHSLPLADITFSTEGSHLYSGGGEACLVKWNLNSGEKSFLPRVGAPILWIKDSPDGSCVVTSLEDNSLQIIDPQRNVVGLIQGLTKGHFRGDPKQSILSTGLLYDPQTKSLVLNGKSGHLQFYSVFDDKHLFNLDISSKNFITHERDHQSYNVDVSKAAIDVRGHWLATVEYWCNGEVSPMIWLKFWEYDIVKQKFIMNTNIYLPHEKEVNCILFQPNASSEESPLCVTTSNDCLLKTWTLYDDNRFEGKQSWNCALTDYYREHLPTGDASFSEDGSVLAVAVANIATLWTESNTHLEAVLFQEKDEKPIKQLRFGKQSCSHLLVCHNGSEIYVWNVLSLSITFSIHVDVQTIASDIASDLIVVFSTNADEKFSNLYLFKPDSPNPVLFIKNVSDKPVLSALFVPRKSNIENDDMEYFDKSQLFFFNEDQCLLTLTDECDDDLESNLQKIKMSRHLPMTPFGLLQAEQKTSHVKPIEHQALVIEHTDTTKDSLEYPNPTYINHFAICSKVLRSLLLPKLETEPVTNVKNKEKKKQNKGNEEPDIHMEINTDKTIETVNKKEKDFTIRFTNFSFLRDRVNLPMS